MLPEWLLSLIAGALAFATADVLCDVVIDEDDEYEDDDPHGGTVVAPALEPLARRRAQVIDRSRSKRRAEPHRLKRAWTKSARNRKCGGASCHGEPSPNGVGLTGAQDAAISGIVNTLAWLALCLSYRLQHRGTDAASLSAHLKWRPSTHPEFWFALLGGGCAFCHDFFLLRAFEGAPSTVILPLIQVASVSVLLGSSALAYHRGEQWLTFTHAVAYFLMFIGGLLPATGGDIGLLARKSFWRQRYVAFAILSELTYGMHDLLASACAYESNSHSAAAAAAAAASRANRLNTLW